MHHDASTPWLRYGFAGAIALIGVVLAWRAIVPAQRGSGGETSSSAPTETEPNGDGPPSPALDFEIVVTPETVAEVVEEATEQIDDAIRSMPRRSLGVEAERAFVQEARTQLEIYLGGAFDKYLAYIEARGADMSALRGATDEERREKLERFEAFWEETASPFALRPISLEEVDVRPRFINGEKIEYEGPGRQSGVAISPDRYEIPGVRTVARSRGGGEPSASVLREREAVRAGLTIYEVLVPVLYRWEETEAPAYLGLWFAWDRINRRWVIWQISTYELTDAGVSISPVY